MKKIILFILLSTFSYAQENYNVYHKKINKAEQLYFIENKVDSALYQYDKAFEEYSFNFLRDLVNAAQIAKLNKKPYLKYIYKGFEFGLKLDKLNNYPLFKNEVLKLKKDKVVNENYAKARKKYIESIDFEYLNWLQDVAIKDQADKEKINYNRIISNTLNKLEKKIIEKGFPGDRVVGISDSLLFYEINKPYLSIKEKIKRTGDKSLRYFTKSDDASNTGYLGLILLVHHCCAYDQLSKILKDEITKGNIHPRDVGMVADNALRFYGEMEQPYLLNIYANSKYTNDHRANPNKINKVRRKIGINTIEVDNAKIEFEAKYNLKLISGFFDCR
jgi:hypothetical protein